SIFTCDLSQAGTQVVTLMNQFGCDSIHTTETGYVGLDTMYLQDQTCDPTKAGIAVVVLPGTYCDTVQVIDDSLVNTLITTETITQCGAQATVYDILLLDGVVGCDSLAITVQQFEQTVASSEVLGE